MKIHIVKKGDTLYELSQKYNVPLEKLIEANPQIANPDQLSIGEKVKIPAGAVQVEGEGYKHVAKEGDTLWKLSKAWGIPLQTLIDANPQISDPNVLKVGDVVLIPVKGGGMANPPGHGGENVAPGTGGKKNTAPIPTPLPAPAPEVKPTPPKEEMTKPNPIAPTPKPMPMPNPNPPAPKPMPMPNPNPPTPKLMPMPNPNPPAPKPMPMPMPNPNPPLPPIKVEFVEEIKFQSIQKEEKPCKPVPECPDPWSSPFYSMDPYGGGGMMHSSSPCGCEGNIGHTTHLGHHTHPMKENMNMHEEMPSGNVSSFYDFPQLPDQGPSMMGGMMDNGAYTGGYPGIGNDHMHHSHEMHHGHEMMGMEWSPMGYADNQPWGQGQGDWVTPMPYSDNNAPANMSPNMGPNMSPNMAPNSHYPGVSPQHCGPGPVWPMHSCGCHYRYPYGYEYPVNSFDPYPMNYNSNSDFVAPGGQQPVWFEDGFGTFNEINNEREQQTEAFKEVTISEQKENTGTSEASKPQAQTRSKGKKEVKISGSSASSTSKKSGSKRTSSKSGASSQKGRTSSTRRNPWSQR
ncbi:LysM domain-containing protein [Paenibacillus motobuensis]|uniref:LysM domain-containing protein n=1 Tax=Paenibacillus motobuensis TaxID=295324 RepID=A0ABN0YIR5_9BACL